MRPAAASILWLSRKESTRDIRVEGTSACKAFCPRTRMLERGKLELGPAEAMLEGEEQEEQVRAARG